MTEIEPFQENTYISRFRQSCWSLQSVSLRCLFFSKKEDFRRCPRVDSSRSAFIFTTAL